MAIAAEALLRLKAVLDDEGFRKAEGALKGLDNQAKRTGGTIGGRVNRPLDRMEKGLDRVNNSRPMQAVNRGLVATGAGLGLAVKAAVDFENEFSGVRKQLGLDIKSPILDTYRRQLLDLSTKTPTPVAALARIATEGAKIGLRANPLMEYVNQVQKASKAMEIPAEELVGNFNGINAALQQSPRQGYKMLDYINRLDDDLAGQVSSRQILEGMSRIGSFPKIAGVKPQDTAAMLSTIIAQNKTPEQSATGLKNFLLPLAGGSQALTPQKQAALAELYGMPIDPARKQLQDELKQINSDIVEFGGNARADAIEKLIEDAKFQGKKFIEFEGKTLNFTQAGIIKKRLNEGNKEISVGLKERKKQIEAQLKAMPTGGRMLADDLAKRMQVDSRGTILDVIKRIKELPKDKQLGFVTEFFGKDSASEIMALVNNTNLLKSAFGLVDQEIGKTKGQIGSVQKEYDTLLQGAPAQLEMFKNALMAPAIEIGRTLLPALLELTRALKPMIDGFTTFIRQNPEAVTNFVKIAGAIAGLRVALWALGGVIGTFKLLGETIKGFGTGIKFLVGLPRTIAGTLGAVGPMVQKLKGLGGGGGGFFGGIVTAAKGLAGRVMGPIKGLVGMIRIAFAGLTFQEVFPGLANRLQQLKNTVAGIFGKGGASKALSGAANNIRPTVLRPVNTIKPFTRIPPVANPMPWLGSIGTALARLGPLLLGFGSTVARVFMGPVGWVTLLIGAGVALYAFRNQIGQFVASVGPALAGVFAPLRNLAGGLMTAISTSLANLGTMLAPVWAQIAAAFRTYVVTPIQQVWNFLVVWIGQTIAAYTIVWWQGVVQGFNLYVVQPIQAAWNFLLQALALAVQGLATVWAGISQAFNTYVVVPVQTAWNGLVMFFGQGVAYLRGILSQAWAGVSAAFVQWVVTPIAQAWNQLTTFLGGATGPLRNALNSAWQGVAQNFSAYVVQPVSQAWNGLATFVGNAAGGMVRAFQGAWANVAGAVRNGVITPLQNMFDGLASRVRSVFDGLLGWARGIANWAVNAVNNVRQRAGFQPLQPQGFAKGGYVNGPTLGLIGEGRDPREYIIPERKMAGAAMNYLSGKRGASVLSGVPRFAGGGFVQGAKTFNFKGGKGAYMEINGRRISLDNLEEANKEFARIADANTLEMEKTAAKSQGLSLSAYKKQQERVQSLFFGGAETEHYKRVFGQTTGGSIIRAGASSYPQADSREMADMQRRMRDSELRRRSMNARVRVSRALSGVNYDAVISGTGARRSGYSRRNSSRYPNEYQNQMQRTLLMQAKSQRRSEIAKMQAMLDRAKTENDRIANMDDFYFRLYLDSKSARGTQAYAKGGYVNKPTLGLIGEAGDNEYIIPERRMAASAMAFLSGARGLDVINPPKFANGGVVGSSMANRSGNLNTLLERTGAIGGQTVVVQDPTINATIQVQTGDVLQFEGQQYVTLSDYQRGLKQVQSETLGLLRTAQGRRATGR